MTSRDRIIQKQHLSISSSVLWRENLVQMSSRCSSYSTSFWLFSIKDQRKSRVIFILLLTCYQYPFLPLNLDLVSNIDLLHSKNEYCKALQCPSFKHCRGDFPSWSTQADCSRHAPRSSFTPAHAPPSGLSS